MATPEKLGDWGVCDLKEPWGGGGERGKVLTHRQWGGDTDGTAAWLAEQFPEKKEV